MEAWQPYFIALMIGLLVGFEREKSHRREHSMGIRTFLLISLLGAVTGGMTSPWIAGLVTLFTFSLIAIAYFNQTRRHIVNADVGLTTEFAAGMVFCLGYAAHQAPALAAVAGPIVAVILFSKQSLHRFIHALRPSELQAALLLFLTFVVVVNLVPDSTIDPWGVFNPHKFGYLILILASLEFLSYVMVKIIGEKKGLLVTGFLGGFVSSTAVLLSTARRARDVPGNWRALTGSALAAKLAALIELLVIVSLVSTSLAGYLLGPIVGGIAVGGLLLFLLARSQKSSPIALTVKSPLDWLGVFRLAIALGTILAAISAAKLWMGERALMAVSFLTGLFELHGVSLANATMFSQGKIDYRSACLNIFLAVIASLIAKIALVWIIGRGKYARATTAIFTLLIITLCGLAWLLVLDRS